MESWGIGFGEIGVEGSPSPATFKWKRVYFSWPYEVREGGQFFRKKNGGRRRIPRSVGVYEEVVALLVSLKLAFRNTAYQGAEGVGGASDQQLRESWGKTAKGCPFFTPFLPVSIFKSCHASYPPTPPSQP